MYQKSKLFSLKEPYHERSASELEIIEEAKIFGKGGSQQNLTKYRKAINETAGRLALENPGILAHRGIHNYKCITVLALIMI